MPFSELKWDEVRKLMRTRGGQDELASFHSAMLEFLILQGLLPYWRFLISVGLWRHRNGYLFFIHDT